MICIRGTKLVLVQKLQRMGAKRIYLSHKPNEESEARSFADFLRKAGFVVIVAADARPHKDFIHDKDDASIISKVIASCDVTVVVNP